MFYVLSLRTGITQYAIVEEKGGGERKREEGHFLGLRETQGKKKSVLIFWVFSLCTFHWDSTTRSALAEIALLEFFNFIYFLT